MTHYLDLSFEEKKLILQEIYYIIKRDLNEKLPKYNLEHLYLNHENLIFVSEKIALSALQTKTDIKDIKDFLKTYPEKKFSGVSFENL